MKIYSLLKATFSQDMNIFKISLNNNSSKLKKIILPTFLFCLMLYSMGVYAYAMAQILFPMQQMHVLITLYIVACTLISFVEGIYKSQGILFDAKDNNLLLSLPIKKSHILVVRVLKLLTFQYLFNLMFLLPAFIVYAYYIQPDINFYIIALITSILVPIIPTVCGSAIGYLIRLISSKVNKKKLIQFILSAVITLGVFVIIINMNNFINGLVTNAESVNETIIQMYYPIRLYLNLIVEFNLVDFVILLIINTIPLGVLVLVGAKYYYKIIYRISESGINNARTFNVDKIRYRKPMTALALKETKRYFSSPIYILNTLVGPAILFITTISLCLKVINISASTTLLLPFDIESYLPAIYYALVVTICGLTQITASAISVEGKTINLIRSLPVSEKTIFNSKICMSFIIQLPIVIISNFLFIFKFRVNLYYSLLIFGITLAAMFLISCLGLIINLKYPKMDANNDTEIVKQSMSSMIATFSGMIILGISVGLVIYLSSFMSLELALLYHLSLVAILGSISYIFLMKKGPNIYRKINA